MNENMYMPMSYPDSMNPYQRMMMAQAQQRNNPYYNNSFQPNMNQPNNNQNYVSTPTVRAVTGYEEVLACQIPLDGSISVFTDFSHGLMYTKQLNLMDGTALIKTYAVTENPKNNFYSLPENTEYVKKSEFEELKSRFNTVWDALNGVPNNQKQEQVNGDEKL